MATPVLMPLMGMTMEEGIVSKWLVEAGATVTKGQEILEFETDKINATVEAPEDGVLGGLTAQPGDAVPVQGVLAYILEPGEEPPAAEAPPAAAPEPAPAPAAPPPAPAAPPPAPAPAPAPVVAAAPVAAAADGRIKSSPLARRIARELGVVIAGLAGSGPGGRIIERDVREAAAAAPAVAVAPTVAVAPAISTPAIPAAIGEPAAGTTIPVAGVRKVIAERMLQSLQQSAQVTLVTEVDGRRFHELRTELAARHEPALGFKISYNDLLIRVCAHALREHPRANASLDGDVIRLHEAVNVGLAIEAGGDLVVANVKQADRKSLVEIASDLRGVVERARANQLALDDITGGTFTISNLGLYGIDAFTPVLNPPESAILGVGALREKAVARDGEVVAHSRSP